MRFQILGALRVKTVLFNSSLPVFLANNAGPDQMPHSAASDLGLQFANVPAPSPVQVLQLTLFKQHSDVTVTRIAQLYM